MAEREGYLHPGPAPAVSAEPNAESYQELRPAERDRIENDFTDYINRRLGDRPDHETEEEKYRHVVFNYAYERHRAERVGQIRDRNWNPWLQRGYGWIRELGFGVATGAAVKGIGTAAGIVGGPISWIGASVFGGITGGIVGYRRGGERYVTKNLNAARLEQEFEAETLVNQHAEHMNQLHDEQDDRFFEKREIAGSELPPEYYAEVAEVLEKLDRVAQSGMVRGLPSERILLAERRAHLRAVLEQKEFFDEISERTKRGEHYFPPGGAANQDILGKLWVDLQEYRKNHSLAEFYNEGISDRGKQFVEDHRQAAKKASKGGAIAGGISGAIFAGAFSYFLGERMPHGFGKGELEGTKAIGNPMENRDFGSVTKVLEHVAVTQETTPGNFFDADMANAANEALHRYGLPSIEHYVDPKTGTNHLFEFLQRAHEVADPTTGQPIVSKDLQISAEKLQQALYNFLSHYDHSPTGVDPAVWRSQLADTFTFDQLANPNFEDLGEARQLFIDQLRSLGKLNPQSIANLTGFVTQSSLMDVTIGAVAGHAVGQMAGNAAPNPGYSRDTKEQLTITADQFERLGKPLPKGGEIFELMRGASDGKNNSIYETLQRSGEQPPYRFIVKAVAGQGVVLQLLDKDGRPKTDFDLAERDVTLKQLLDPAFRYRGNRTAPENPPGPAAPTTPAHPPLTPDASAAIERVNRILNTERDYRIDITGAPGAYSIAGNNFDPSTGLPIQITNLNDPAIAPHVNGYIAAHAADPSAAIRLRITGYDFGPDGKPNRLRAVIVP